MKINQYLLAIVFVIFSNPIFSQDIVINTTTHDFGSVPNMDYPPAAFIFTNSGLEKTAILLVEKSNDVLVQFERKYIMPGEKSRLLVKYNTNELGPFEEKISVIFSNNTNPIILTIKGINTTQLNCFPNPGNLNYRWVHVIDKETKKAVPNAKLQLLYNHNQPLLFNVNNQGKSQQLLKIGQYKTEIIADGYLPYDSTIFIRKSQPIVYFEMQPMTTTSEIQPILTYSKPEVDTISEEPNPDSTSKENILSDPINPNELSRTEYAENNIVLLVDVSLSMRSGNKLKLLKHSINNLITVLRNIDRVSIISYASLSTTYCSGIKGSNKQYLSGIIDSLSAYGITNGVKGLETAFLLAENNFIRQGNNQVILATDGKFNGNNISVDVYKNMIREAVNKNIQLSIIGFGIDEEAIKLMKEMAEIGKGTYIHVDKQSDTSNTIIEEIKSKSKKNILSDGEW